MSSASASPVNVGGLGLVTAFEAIVRSTCDAIIATTPGGVVGVWNDGASNLYGFTAAQMLGQGVSAIYPPAARQSDVDRHARVALGSAESGVRCQRLCADGRTIDVVMSLWPVHDTQGEVIGIASHSRAITEAERAEERFASLLAAAPDAIVCAGADGKIAIVNAQTSRLFGYDEEELIGADVEVLLPESLRAGHVVLRGQYLQAPRVRAMGSGLSLLARHRDGSEFPVEVSLAYEGASEGGLVIAAIRDISAQRALQELASENERRLRQLAESVDLVFVLLQLDPLEYLYVSPGAQRLLGGDDRIGLQPAKVLQLVHPDDRERVERDYVLPSRAGLPAVSEHRIVLADGSGRWVRATATPVATADGPATRSVLTLEDISDRVAVAEALREAEATARAANESKNLFLSRMSHELRTPLNAVLGFGQILSRQLRDTEHAESIGHVLKGGRHLLDLINDVLDIARIESGQISVSLEPVALAPMLEEVVQLMGPLAVEADVTLVGQPLPASAHVLADRQRLRQILLNLVSNAIKYNHPGGHVWMESDEQGEQTRITVRDDGQGIAGEDLERVFTPFDRLGAEASGIEGSGIGLALTQSLALLQGGTIDVSSTFGSGSSFSVALASTPPPHMGSGPQGSAADPAPAEAAPARESTLLYIEDNEPNVRVMEHLLRLRPSWRLIHAGLGRLGVELALGHRPDLVLLDLHLPDLSGSEVLTLLKGHAATAGIPIGVLTADASPGLARRLLGEGAARFLTKPLDIDEVLSLLDDAAARAAAP